MLPESLESEKFGIWSATLGYVYDFEPLWSVVPGVGGAFEFALFDPDLEPFYGHRSGYGFQLFFRLSAPRR